MSRSRVPAIALIAAGSALGYFAASIDLSASRPALAARTSSSPAPSGEQSVGCSDGADKGLLLAGAAAVAVTAVAADPKPNIVVIMGDDIGVWNIGAYHRGMMAGRTPNLDRLAAQGMLFTDYYAEASCTAGRANFITGQLPIRTGMTTVGQAGSPDRPARAGPNHRDGSQVNGICHGPVRQEPPGRLERVPADRPRLRRVLRLPLSPGCDGRPGPSQLPARAQGQDRPAQHGAFLGDRARTIPRSSRAGARSASSGSRTPARSIPNGWRPSTTRSSNSRSSSSTRPRGDGKPFFLWLNPTRMHIVTHLSEKYQKLRTPANGWSIHEAGMAQLDDIVGSVMKKLEDMGAAEDTIVLFTTDNGTENFTWPDGGQTPFAGGKGTVMEGGFRAPAILRWPGKVPAGKVENGIISGLDWFPTFVAAAGNPSIVDELKQGKAAGRHERSRCISTATTRWT